MVNVTVELNLILQARSDYADLTNCPYYDSLMDFLRSRYGHIAAGKWIVQLSLRSFIKRFFFIFTRSSFNEENFDWFKVTQFVREGTE